MQTRTNITLRQDVSTLPDEIGRGRVTIEAVQPEVDCGRFPIKRTTGERVIVEADIFAEGHDLLSGQLLYRRENPTAWESSPLEHIGNDRWRGEFTVDTLGRYVYALHAWVDHFETWRRDIAVKAAAGQVLDLDFQIGANLVDAAGARADGIEAARLRDFAERLRDGTDLRVRLETALDPALRALMTDHPDTRFATTYDKGLAVVVDRERARFSTWYEIFPRSAAPEAGQHGTFKDVEARLPYIAAMGFDVLYLPPIHPIGRTFRKGPNNTTPAGPGDPGSPWAIGTDDGGHTAIHPALGTTDDFRSLVEAARNHGIEVATDLAFQTSPDHPYVSKHPEWFRVRPDGTIQYAENPPKKYQDIFPFDFESDRWRTLWSELAGVVRFWIELGIRIFRVDNPHTKPFRFWEWLIAEIKREYPDVIFLSEAFTRPKVMYHLAKAGFTQSYTYFTWRTRRRELTDYLTELTTPPVREFFRPSLWPNTPDILTEQLQHGGWPAFASRLILAATLGASYGIYGPAFELGENRALEPGREEYLDSEKYQLRHWDLERPDSLRDLIARVNQIRRENPALQSDWSLQFHPVDNELLIAYSKVTRDGDSAILTIVNLDAHHRQSGWVEFPLDRFGLDPHQSYQLHDLLTDARYLWSGPRNYVELDPHAIPAHILLVRRRVRNERDFEYFM